MADNTGTLIKLAAVGAAGYWAYSQGWLSFLGLTPGATSSGTPTTPTSPATVPVTPPAATPPNATTPPASAPPPAATPSVLDGIFSRIQAAAGTNAQLDPDNWGWYLNNELAKLSKPAAAGGGSLVAPDPVPLFGQRPFTAMSAAAWWGPMSQALRTQLGLSGLGIYGGLAAIAASRRYRR